METKRCTTCNDLKPLTEFNKQTARKDGRQSSCRVCTSARYLRTRDLRQAQIKARKREVYERFLSYLANCSCADCGENDPVVLEFDHLRDKHANVASLAQAGASWATIEAEIAKCEVRCANCHRRLTAQRGGFYRTLIAEPG
jgi:hypothetical protein